MPKFSIVTLVMGRRKQLANLLQSIKASTILPFDIQVVCMDHLQGIEIPEGLNVELHLIEEKSALPLAAARNRGIAATKTAKIMFIDVDCIVSPSLFANMLQALQAKRIIAAYPLYLPLVPNNGNYAELEHQAFSHPARKHIPAAQPVEHLLFWSLIFAIEKQSFERIGGFDESFTGYGAEDTDFAMLFHQGGLQQVFVQDYVLHQYHDKYDPPLNYFDSIIENARRYQQKWGVLPMQPWLKAFEKMGLLKIEENDQLSVYQKPTDKQIKDSVSTHPY